MSRPDTPSSSDSSTRTHHPDAPAAQDTSAQVYADVLVPRHLNRRFTYRIPGPFLGRLTIGSLVTVPFGHSTVQGLIVAMWGASQKPASGNFPLPLPLSRLKDILAVPDEGADGVVSRELLELTRFVAERYLAPWGQCIRLAVPPPVTVSKKTRPRREPKVCREAQEALSPLPLPSLPATWQNRFASALDGGTTARLLLHAPLAHRIAGYMEVCRLAQAGRRTVLIISPDIARATLIAGSAVALWGKQVELLHSGLMPAARAAAWHNIRTGTVQVVVGTRSAVFAPLTSLGCLCIDQEDDASLKEEQEPRYHAREVARMRADQHKAVLLLGSSHPSLETWQELDLAAARPEPASAPARLTIDGAGSLAPPEIQLIDLRRQPYGTLLSQIMLDGIQAALATGERAVLFLNRKGFAPALLCRDCGKSSHCPQCSVTLTYYRKAGKLGCRYCGLALPLPETCPTCQATTLEPVGSGTERLEEVIRRRFAQARIIRLDRERARTPEKAETLRRQAATGEWDILIGTQMLFQGTPLPPVGFVGIPQADEGLHAPDFRAAERTYHALLDAVELAKPAQAGGRVVMQTYLPAHHTVTSVMANNPALFYEEEMASRQALGYPPAAHLINLRVSGREAAQVQQAARRWAKLIATANPAPGVQAQVTVMGPIPATIALLRGKHRWQLLVKSVDGLAGRLAVKSTLDKIEETYRKGGLKFEVDVDPLEMG